MPRNRKQKAKIDAFFVVGFFLLIFLTVLHVFVKEIPAHIVLSPLFIMGFGSVDINIAEIIRAIRGK